MKILKRLSDIFKEHKYCYLTGLVLMFLSPILEFLFPHLGFIMLFMFFCGGCTMIYGILLYAEKRGSLIAKVLRYTAHALIACFIITFIFLESLIIPNAKTTAETSDCIFVLGCGLHGDELTLMGKARADKAIEFLKENPDCIAIMCGGKGNGEKTTEADALYDYIADAGIERKRLIKEDKSLDTTQNINFAKEIVKEQGLDPTTDEFAVVTNDFHLYRSVLISKKAGFTNVEMINAPTPRLPFLRICMYLREYFSLMLEFFNI